jgi:hypothetical protein
MKVIFEILGENGWIRLDGYTLLEAVDFLQHARLGLQFRIVSPNLA